MLNGQDLLFHKKALSVPNSEVFCHCALIEEERELRIESARLTVGGSFTVGHLQTDLWGQDCQLLLVFSPHPVQHLIRAGVAFNFEGRDDLPTADLYLQPQQRSFQLPEQLAQTELGADRQLNFVLSIDAEKLLTRCS